MGSSLSKIAVFGGGASGLLVASQLLRQARHPIHVVLYEPRPAPGTGTAYGTRDTVHLLNVPAKKMSALPDQPNHFLEWLNAPSNCATLVNGRSFTGEDFVPRAIYARYLAAVLEGGIQVGKGCNCRFEHRQERSVDFIVGESGGTVVSESADTEDVAHAVLALGNMPPRNPMPQAHPFFKSDRYTPYVWQDGALEGIDPEEDLLIVGSGLTSLDVVATLHRNGHQGKILVTSRNGRLPQSHVPASPYRDFLAGIKFPTTARGWFRLIKSELANARRDGVPWQSVLDAIRPHTQKIWLALDLVEKRRFLRHLRSFWESHRHRAPAKTRLLLERLQLSGQVVFLPGRIRDFKDGEGAVTVSLQRRGGEMIELRVLRVLNCIGPESNFGQHLNDPLVINLMARGTIHPDHLFLGLNADPDGALVSAGGSRHHHLSAIGPPLRGVLWETTAIPEVRQQAASLAARILKSLDHASWQI